MNKLIVILCIFSASVIYGQNVFIETGLNLTEYNYKDPLGNNNDNISTGAAYYLRAGLGKIIENNNLYYGLSIQKYNSAGGNNTDFYEWDVTHLGVFSDYILPLNENKDRVFFTAGLELSMMINGNQKIGGQSFNLSEYDEFKGLWINPKLGFSYRAFQAVEVGYFFQFGLNPMNSSEEKLSFVTHKIGIKLNL